MSFKFNQRKLEIVYGHSIEVILSLEDKIDWAFDAEIGLR